MMLVEEMIKKLKEYNPKAEFATVVKSYPQ